MIVGLVTVMFSLPVMLDPAKYQCQLSRVRLDDANKDKKDWNNVETGVQKVKDLPCPDAVRLSREIPLNEKGKKVPLPSESALQTQNGIAVAMGIGQAYCGFSVIRTLNRRARIAAIALSLVAGTLFPVLDILSVGVFVFVGYAFALSPASREIWPRQVRG
jgi:hypothetical protein